jgi:hypothetical protein
MNENQTFKAKLIFEDRDYFIMETQNEINFSIYNIIYMLDKKIGDLYITGDCGSCIFHYGTAITPEYLAIYLQDNNVEYFIEKTEYPEDLYTYFWNDICRDLDELRDLVISSSSIPKEKLSNAYKGKISEDFATMYHIVNQCDINDLKNNKYPDNLIELFNKYISDLPTLEFKFMHLGRRVSQNVYDWTSGFQEGLRQLRENCNDNDKKCSDIKTAADYKMVLFGFDNTLCIHTDLGNPSEEKYNQKVFIAENPWKNCIVNDDCKKLMKLFYNKQVPMGLISCDRSAIHFQKKIDWVKNKMGFSLENYCVGLGYSKINMLKAISNAYNIPEKEILLIDDDYDLLNEAVDIGFSAMSPVEIRYWIMEEKL